MKVLIVGGGGREHAIAWACSRSRYVQKVYVAPGNGGVADIAEIVSISDRDIRSLANFAEKTGVDLTIVGPEAPLAMGIVDYFNKRGLRIFGPTQDAAKIESSKIFAKDFMKRFNIATASYRVFTDPEKAVKFMEEHPFPVVIKADGLAAGKGVVVAKNIEDGKDAVLKMMIERSLGEAGQKIVIEQFLTGTEMSVMALTDGETAVTLLPSMDYKRAHDNNQGPNTGGMGAIAPHPLATPEIMKNIEETIIQPAIDGLRQIGTPFQGVLYTGLMLTDYGPKVLEFNCRFGDPETQSVLPLLETDFVEAILHIIEGHIDELVLDWENKHSLVVMMASGGYPRRYKKGFEIEGLDDINDHPNLVLFHSGTLNRKNGYITNGGRVLGVVAKGKSLKESAELAYRNVHRIHFKNGFYRRDIGRPFI